VVDLSRITLLDVPRLLKDFFGWITTLARATRGRCARSVSLFLSLRRRSSSSALCLSKRGSLGKSWLQRNRRSPITSPLGALLQVPPREGFAFDPALSQLLRYVRYVPLAPHYQNTAPLLRYQPISLLNDPEVPHPHSRDRKTPGREIEMRRPLTPPPAIKEISRIVLLFFS
jgi:hypothetical protein